MNGSLLEVVGYGVQDDAPPLKRPRRTREQIIQDKIARAEAKLDEERTRIRRKAKIARFSDALKHLEKALHCLTEDDIDEEFAEGQASDFKDYIQHFRAIVSGDFDR